MPVEWTPNKHQLKTEATRKKLFKAALRTFARQGFAAATIDDIAKEAGYTRGAFYAHFEGKDDLFLALLEERSTADLERLRAELLSTGESERLKVLRRFYVTRIHDKQWALLLLEAKLYAARHRSAGAKLTERLRAVRMRLKQQYLGDVIPQELTERRSLLLESMLDGMILKRAYDPGTATDEESEKILSDFFDAVRNGLV